MYRILLSISAYLALAALFDESAFCQAPNILFIAVDDFRPEAGSYGVERAITPNIDQLASRGVKFERAYVTYPLCLPSRASMLTGLRVDYKRDGKGRDFPELIQLGATWPKIFRSAGYWTATAGKVYHGKVPRVDIDAWDVPGVDWLHEGHDWSEELQSKVVAQGGQADQLQPFIKSGKGGPGALVWQSIDDDDEALNDGQTATRIISYLHERPKDKPFVICAGFHRPHMPWVAPKKYFDLYDESVGTLAPMPENAPREVAKEDVSRGVAGNAAALQWNEGVNDEQARLLIRGYLACVSYVDAQIGKILHELAAQGLDENTIVVLWGDHGYHLTDHGLWRKNTIYHVANRIPLIIKAPGYASGQSSSAIVETIDLYPTLLELTGVSAESLQLDGKSLIPWLKDPSLKSAKPAFISGGKGYGMVNDQYRFSIDKSGNRKLFDLTADPGEWHDLSSSPKFASLVAAFEQQVEQTWKAAR